MTAAATPDRTHLHRPGITRTGAIVEDGQTIVVKGWALTTCMAACRCHTDPRTGQLVMRQDLAAGTLGLASFHPACACCRPWTVAELRAIALDLANAPVLRPTA